MATLYSELALGTAGTSCSFAPHPFSQLKKVCYPLDKRIVNEHTQGATLCWTRQPC